jgi:hypothetical protein
MALFLYGQFFFTTLVFCGLATSFPPIFCAARASAILDFIDLEYLCSLSSGMVERPIDDFFANFLDVVPLMLTGISAGLALAFISSGYRGSLANYFIAILVSLSSFFLTVDQFSIIGQDVIATDAQAESSKLETDPFFWPFFSSGLLIFSVPFTFIAMTFRSVTFNKLEFMNNINPKFFAARIRRFSAYKLSLLVHLLRTMIWVLTISWLLIFLLFLFISFQVPLVVEQVRAWNIESNPLAENQAFSGFVLIAAPLAHFSFFVYILQKLLIKRQRYILILEIPILALLFTSYLAHLSAAGVLGNVSVFTDVFHFLASNFTYITVSTLPSDELKWGAAFILSIFFHASLLYAPPLIISSLALLLFSWVKFIRHFQSEYLRGLRLNLIADGSKFDQSHVSSKALLLRSFSEDLSEIRASNFLVAHPFRSKLKSVSMIEAISEVVFLTSPIVAAAGAGFPKNYTGVPMNITEGDEWQGYIARMIESAETIIVILANTDSLKWEVEQIFKSGAERNSVFLFPESSEEVSNVLSTMPDLESLFSHFNVKSGDLVYYDRSDRVWVPIKGSRSSEFRLQESLRYALHRKHQA